jgi:hypothetical protein
LQISNYEETIKELRHLFGEMGHDKEWEKLRDRIMSQKHTASSLRKLGRDVKDFFRSGAPQEDKIKLRGYAESLEILMDAVKNGLLK